MLIKVKNTQNLLSDKDKERIQKIEAVVEGCLRVRQGDISITKVKLQTQVKKNLDKIPPNVESSKHSKTLERTILHEATKSSSIKKIPKLASIGKLYTNMERKTALNQVAIKEM